MFAGLQGRMRAAPAVTEVASLVDLCTAAIVAQLNGVANMPEAELKEVAETIMTWPCAEKFASLMPVRIVAALLALGSPLVTAEMLDKTIAREEHAYCDSRALERSAKYLPPRDTSAPPPLFALVDVFAEVELPYGPSSKPAKELLLWPSTQSPPAFSSEQILFENKADEMPSNLLEGIPEKDRAKWREMFNRGPLAFAKGLDNFERNLDVFSGGLLEGLEYDGVFLAGGAALACALSSPGNVCSPPYKAPPSSARSLFVKTMKKDPAARAQYDVPGSAGHVW